MTDDLHCARCGVPTSRGSGVYTKLRGAGGGGKSHEFDPAFLLCSPRCLEAEVADAIRSTRCDVCGKVRRRGIGKPGQANQPGRPNYYCSDECLRVHKKRLAQALRDLVKNRHPKTVDEANEMLGAIEGLRRHWHDGGDLVKPSERAIRALEHRRTKVAQDREHLLEKANQEAARKEEARARAAWEKAKAEAAELEAKWRKAIEAEAQRLDA